MTNTAAMPLQTVRETLHLLGYINSRYGRADRAIGYFQLMTVIDAGNPVAWRALATIQLTLDQNPQALASAEKALELGVDPNERSLCQLVRAIATRRLGDPAESDKAAAEYLKERRATVEEM